MPTIKLTPTACTVAGGWHDLRYYLNDDDLRQVIFTYPNNATLGGPGINITNISIKGYARNSSTATKRLIIGFKDSTAVATSSWSKINNVDVRDGVFTAVTSSNGSWKYANITRVYSASGNTTVFGLFAEHIQSQFSSGAPIYMGIIQPDRSKSINVNTSLNYWTIEVTYELLGNVPSADVNTAVIGSTPITTTLNKVIPSSSTTIRYKIGDEILSTKDIGAGVTDVYIPPTSAGDYFPNTLNTTLTVEAETFVGSESYGTVSTSVTLTLPSDANPTATCALSRTWVSGVDASSQIAAYVQTKSGVSFALGGSAKYGATVASYRVVIENKTYSRTGAGSVTHSPITGSGVISYTYTITDSRGTSNTYTGSINVLAWSDPKITRFAVTRVTEDNTGAVDGTYARINVVGSVSDLTVDDSQKNSITYYVRYREIGNETWINSDTTPLDAITASQSSMIKRAGVPVGTFNDMVGYEFQLVFSDIYSSSTSSTEMPTKETYWDVDESTGSMGFGGESVSDGTALRYDFYGPVYFRSGAVGQMAYTNTETDTGIRWIDGRPVYCKTFRGAYLVDGDGNGTVLGYISDLGEVVRFDGYVRRADSDTIMSLNYPYFNNSQQMIAVNVRNDGAVRLIKGSAWTCKTYVVSVLYTKSSDKPVRYYLPFLTSDNEQGCIISASSEYSGSYQAELAFNGLTGNHWACTDADTQRWIQVEMPYAMRNVIVTLTNPKDSGGTLQTNAVNIPTVGTFLGSNSGASWVEIGNFSGRSTAEGDTTMHSLMNGTGYKYLRVQFTTPGASTNTWGGFSDIRIEGEVV